MEKYIPCKHYSKEGRRGYAYIRQNGFSGKICKKRQRTTLYNDERINSIGIYNNYKYIFAPIVRVPKNVK